MNEEMRMLLAEAKEAKKWALPIMSHFRVGAAVLANGRMHRGANIESIISDLGMCAERVAIAHALMHGDRDIEGIAICCGDDEDSGKSPACLPCGACLQWIADLAPNAWIVTDPGDEVYYLKDLLPKPYKFVPSGSQ